MLDQPIRVESAAPRTITDADHLTGGEILAILRRRKFAWLIPLLAFPLLSYIAISQITPLYTATGSLLYDPSEYKLRELQSILRSDPITEAVMASQAEVLRGLPIVTQMVTRLNLADQPEFNPALRQPGWLNRTIGSIRPMLEWLLPSPAPHPDPHSPLVDVTRYRLLHNVQDALQVAPLKASHVLQVSFTASDPMIAAAAVNSAMDIYVKNQIGVKFGAVSKAIDWLKARANELRSDVHEKEARIVAYRQNAGLVDGMHANLDVEQISQAGENLQHARNDLAEAEGRLNVAAGREGAGAQAAIATSVAQLRSQQAALSAQLQPLLTRLGPSHPEAVAARRQLTDVDQGIAAEIRRVVAAAEAEVHADRQRVASLEQNLRDVQARLARDSEAQVALNAMQRDAEASRSLLQSVLERIQQTAQQAAIETPDAHEISLALPPAVPSSPRTVPLMAAGSSFGLLFGLLLVYLRELTDSTFHTGNDIRQALGLPCLALLPLVRRRTLGRLSVDQFAAHNPHTALAEQLRALWAALHSQSVRPRSVAITAARQAEGKTTVVLALGRLAAMNGVRVVVLDCDIGNPSFGNLLHGPGEPGLVDWLQGSSALTDVIRKDRLSGMDWIPAGKACPDALGLLMSDAMARLLLKLRDDYDLVLLDTPPAQAVTGARVVAANADATVLCVRWRATHRNNVLNAIELLDQAHANVVGAALTQVDLRSHVRSGYADAAVYHPRYGKYSRG